MCLTRGQCICDILFMDLKKIVIDLERAGLTQAQIAERTPCAQSTVSGIKTGARGARPGYQLTQALVALHKKVVRKAKKVVRKAKSA